MINWHVSRNFYIGIIGGDITSCYNSGTCMIRMSMDLKIVTLDIVLGFGRTLGVKNDYIYTKKMNNYLYIL